MAFKGGGGDGRPEEMRRRPALVDSFVKQFLLRESTIGRTPNPNPNPFVAKPFGNLFINGPVCSLYTVAPPKWQALRHLPSRKWPRLTYSDSFHRTLELAVHVSDHAPFFSPHPQWPSSSFSHLDPSLPTRPVHFGIIPAVPLPPPCVWSTAQYPLPTSHLPHTAHCHHVITFFIPIMGTAPPRDPYTDLLRSLWAVRCAAHHVGSVSVAAAPPECNADSGPPTLSPSPFPHPPFPPPPLRSCTEASVPRPLVRLIRSTSVRTIAMQARPI